MCTDCKQDGAFLVRRRENTTDKCFYAIDLVCNGQFKHVLIRQRPDKLYAIGAPKAKEKARILWLLTCTPNDAG